MAKKVSIEWILKNVSESSDNYLDGSPRSWAEMLLVKINPVLLKDLDAEGQIDPIEVLGYGERYVLGNGHHRLAAAIMLGWDEILASNHSWAENGYSVEYDDYISCNPRCPDGQLLERALLSTMDDLEQ